jgi:hypothetical protein
MKPVPVRLIGLALLAALIVLACNLSTPSVSAPTQVIDINIYYTQAAQTLSAQFTQQALEATATLPPLPSPTETPAPTETPVPTPTVTPTPSPVPPSPTPTLVPTSTPLPRPCNAAGFEKDVTVPDDTKFTAGSAFTKTWRLRNTGSCPWTTGYSLVFLKGDRMSGEKVNLLPKTVAPGETVDISIDLTAPSEKGTYKGNWILQDTSGNQFGVGASASGSIWVQIRVVELKSGTLLDLVASYCSASWESSAGDLPCPGHETDKEGFVIRLDEPHHEGRPEDEPALWTYPEMVKDGWIMGTFPAVKIKDGDHFLADVGCLYGYLKCNVEFQLKYKVSGGSTKTLYSVKEEYDGEITRLDVDLSDLAGKEVQIILYVDTNGSPADDAAFWLVPHIERP